MTELYFCVSYNVAVVYVKKNRCQCFDTVGLALEVACGL